MTTCAWRAGAIAADRMLDGWMNTGKLFRLKDGSVLTGAGNMDDIIEVAQWINGGCKEDAKPALDKNETDFLLVRPDGKAYWLTEPWLRQVEILDEFYAIGSGAKIALGAMAAGASAKRAVEIACRYDEGTGKGVNVIRIKK